MIEQWRQRLRYFWLDHCAGAFAALIVLGGGSILVGLKIVAESGATTQFAVGTVTGFQFTGKRYYAYVRIVTGREVPIPIPVFFGCRAGDRMLLWDRHYWWGHSFTWREPGCMPSEPKGA